MKHQYHEEKRHIHQISNIPYIWIISRKIDISNRYQKFLFPLKIQWARKSKDCSFPPELSKLKFMHTYCWMSTPLWSEQQLHITSGRKPRGQIYLSNMESLHWSHLHLSSYVFENQKLDCNDILRDKILFHLQFQRRRFVWGLYLTLTTSFFAERSLLRGKRWFGANWMILLLQTAFDAVNKCPITAHRERSRVPFRIWLQVQPFVWP